MKPLFCGHAESVWMPRLRFAAKWLGLATLAAAVLLLSLEICSPWDAPKEVTMRK